MKKEKTPTWKIILIIFIIFFALIFIRLIIKFAINSTPQQNLPDNKYGINPLQSFDYYYPGSPSDKLIVVIHGGGWLAGDKNYMAPTAEYISEYGYAVANINYRLGNKKIGAEEQLQDIKSAITKITSDKEKYKLTSNPEIILLGHSAGAHLAVLYSVEESKLGMPEVDKAIGFGGPYDITIPGGADWVSELVRDTIIGDGTAEDISANYQVQAGDPTKFLLILGQNDELVPEIQLITMQEALARKGIYVDSIYAEGETHNSPIENFPTGDSLTQNVMEFIVR